MPWPDPNCLLHHWRMKHTNPELVKIGEWKITLAILLQLYRYKKAHWRRGTALWCKAFSHLYFTGRSPQNKGLRLARDAAGQPGPGGWIGRTQGTNASQQIWEGTEKARARTLKAKCWGATCSRVSQKTGAVELIDGQKYVWWSVDQLPTKRTLPSMHTF